MNPSESGGDRTGQILVLTPTGRDGHLASEILSRHSIHSQLMQSMDQLVEGIDQGAGGALIAEEAMLPDATQKLIQALERQPKWSEFPILIFTSQGDQESAAATLTAFSRRANVTLIDRPIRIDTLVSAVRSALRARQHQYEVRDLLEELEQRVHERDQFLAMLGHELRNPLYAIVLASENAETARDEIRSRLDVIRRQSRRLQRLVDDLLDISRVTRGKVALELKVGDLRELAESCIEEMLPLARKESRELTLTVPDHPVYASIDQVRMEQVLINLIVNSLKYTDKGGKIEVRVSQTDDDVMIEVEDDGDGIEPDVLPTIFDLFSQAGTRTDVHQGGLGLGLTLVQRLVELHGGNVEAASEGHGKGTVMTVTLGRADPTSAVADEQEPDSSSRGGENLRILLIEDNEDIRALLAARLERMGHSILQEGTGPGGVEKAVNERPDVALIDIGLPGFDGHEAARRIREEVGDDILLVAVTGYGQPEDKEHALASGFDQHLTKPVNPDDLREIFSRARG